MRAARAALVRREAEELHMRKSSISSTLLIAAGALVGTTMLAVSTPAMATKGREAVGMCIDSTANGSRCEWNVNDQGEIDICNKNGCVYCPSATSDCKVVSRSARPGRKWTLPPGTKIETPYGSHTVTRRVVSDRALLRAMTARSR